ncbi:divergent polysaccharide deacetylase family protein [Helicobacter sp. 11S03491-1]|uniref:divergent polysaccharide deacetylase family protein n=1 Tax=Helicobacter sp. 11S03491-1 TaxID=1476196 RepID=UPI000BA798A0|nr:divergent polysaccharide deacetylase family protein [Helicobacter sp. 11S03491-1]PAF43037.1 hypothetical protein BKH45_02930 [Helicobacter sp. 11S03491-1]
MKKYIISIFSTIVVLGFFGGYWIYQHNLSPKSPPKPNQALSNPNIIPENIPSKDFNLPSQITDAQKPTLSLQHQQKEYSLKSPENLSQKSQKITFKKPKLAIIMDDMAYPWQLKSLHSLELKITPSFFPYNPNNKFTPQMAKNEKFYMIHLPLEALHFYQSPQQWIKTGESKEKIEAYIQNIKQDFPDVHFINNHTGSKFTASYQDMKNLIEILEKYHITFVDSRTTPQTKAPEIYAQMNKPLLSRQVFLDNTSSIDSILNQIKQAIQIAQKKGYAIAICHPHQKTFEALKIAKKTLLKQVELVYIQDIDKLLRNLYAK